MKLYFSKTVALSLFLLLGGGFMLESFGQPPVKNKVPLPDFNFKNSDATSTSPRVGPAELAENRPVMVFYFSPDCDHCNEQAQWIKDQHAKDGSFGGITMIWVSWSTDELNEEFRQKYFKDMSRSMVFMATDDMYKIDDWFGYSEVPTIRVYGKDRLLKQKFNNETAASELIRFARM